MKALSEEVSISTEGATWTLPGTLVLPEREAPVPCVVFFAGSGPTDRNWRSPLLPGGTGSAELLADSLRLQGVGSLRFDKVGSGKNMKPLEVLSLAHYVDEARSAFDLLAARRADCASITLAGHSEGSLHMLSAAVALQGMDRFGGFVSMAGTSRSILDVAIEQIRNARLRQGGRESRGGRPGARLFPRRDVQVRFPRTRLLRDSRGADSLDRCPRPSANRRGARVDPRRSSGGSPELSRASPGPHRRA
jgi:hypothetical protein